MASRGPEGAPAGPAGGAAPDPARLDQLRGRIDALDETLHRALIERSGIIDELIHAKGSTMSEGAIFRPGREADMMRRLAARHAGSLPLPVIEHLWHVIIAAHTALQAPYRVFVDVSGDPLPSWDAARLLVGFTVPVEPCGSPELVIEAMGAGGAALGLVPVAARGDWWTRLGAAPAEGARPGPRIMARTPSIGVPGHPAGEPHWVLSPPLSDPVPFEVALTRIVVPEGTTPDGLGPDEAAQLLASAPAPGRGDGAEAWWIAGPVPPALASAALDTVDCGGYHRPVAGPGG